MKPEDFADNDPYLIIAADSHAGLPTNDYRPYLEKKYHEQLDQFLLEQHELIEASTRLGSRTRYGRGEGPQSLARRSVLHEP